MIFRGSCLLGTELRAVKPGDLVTIPVWTWHHFRATAAEAFGFLCMVNHARDRPQLPAETDMAVLRAVPEVAAFLDGR
jgi:quercetin dioxygenase-like cupin family protein